MVPHREFSGVKSGRRDLDPDMQGGLSLPPGTAWWRPLSNCGELAWEESACIPGPGNCSTETCKIRKPCSLEHKEDAMAVHLHWCSIPFCPTGAPLLTFNCPQFNHFAETMTETQRGSQRTPHLAKKQRLQECRQGPAASLFQHAGWDQLGFEGA